MIVAKVVADMGVVESTRYRFETSAEVMFAQGALEYTIDVADASGGRISIPDDPFNSKLVSADSLQSLGTELELRRSGIVVPSGLDGYDPYLEGDSSKLLYGVLERVGQDAYKYATREDRPFSPSVKAGASALSAAIVKAEMSAKMAGSKAIRVFMQAGRFTKATRNLTREHDPEFPNVSMQWLRKDEYPVYPIVKATAQESLSC